MQNYFSLLVIGRPMKNFAETFQVTASLVIQKLTKGETTVSKTSLSKKLKQHYSTADTPVLDDNNERVVSKTNSSKSLDVNISTLEIFLNQQLPENG